MISHTIENDQDWDLVQDLIDQNVLWSIDITNRLKETILKIQNQGYGRYYVYHKEICYLSLIVLSSDPDIMISSYPKKVINLTPSYRIYYIIGGLSLLAAGGIYFCFTRFQSFRKISKHN